MIYTSIKRFLGRNALTRRTYHGLVRLAHAARFRANKARFGRAFPTSYFDGLFSRDADPWRYEDDEVSKKRKSLILGYLPASPVSSLLEIGCASGWITQDLSPRATRVVAVDCSSVAISLAKERCGDRPNVEFAKVDLLIDQLPGTFEFVMCAGVLNFFPMSEQAAIREKIVGSVQPGGFLLLEHLQERTAGYEVDGIQLHSLYADYPELDLVERRKEDIYEIVLLRRT